MAFLDSTITMSEMYVPHHPGAYNCMSSNCSCVFVPLPPFADVGSLDQSHMSHPRGRVERWYEDTIASCGPPSDDTILSLHRSLIGEPTDQYEWRPTGTYAATGNIFNQSTKIDILERKGNDETTQGGEAGGAKRRQEEPREDEQHTTMQEMGANRSDGNDRRLTNAWIGMADSIRSHTQNGHKHPNALTAAHSLAPPKLSGITPFPIPLTGRPPNTRQRHSVSHTAVVMRCDAMRWDRW